MTRGYFLRTGLSDDEKSFLMENGFRLFKGRLTPSGGSSFYFVNAQSRESSDHALVVWYLADEARKRKAKVEVSATVDADVVVEKKGKRICFEVETGSLLASHGQDYMKEKLEKRKEGYDQAFIVVTRRKLAEKYENITGVKTITRVEIPPLLDSLL